MIKYPHGARITRIMIFDLIKKAGVRKLKEQLSAAHRGISFPFCDAAQ